MENLCFSNSRNFNCVLQLRSKSFSFIRVVLVGEKCAKFDNTSSGWVGVVEGWCNVNQQRTTLPFTCLGGFAEVHFVSELIFLLQPGVSYPNDDNVGYIKSRKRFKKFQSTGSTLHAPYIFYYEFAPRRWPEPGRERERERAKNWFIVATTRKFLRKNLNFKLQNVDPNSQMGIHSPCSGIFT